MKAYHLTAVTGSLILSAMLTWKQKNLHKSFSCTLDFGSAYQTSDFCKQEADMYHFIEKTGTCSYHFQAMDFPARSASEPRPVEQSCSPWLHSDQVGEQQVPHLSPADTCRKPKQKQDFSISVGWTFISWFYLGFYTIKTLKGWRWWLTWQQYCWKSSHVNSYGCFFYFIPHPTPSGIREKEVQEVVVFDFVFT